MTVSPNLEIINVSENQASKATTTNTALLAMERALTDKYDLNTSAAVSAGFDVVIPYSNLNDMSDRTALRFVYLVLSAGATAAFDVIHPNNKHLFVVRNSTTQAATIKTLAGTGPTIAAGGTMLCYADGTNVVDLGIGGGGGSFTRDVSVSKIGSPTSSEVLGSYLASETIDFPADFAGSQMHVPTNPIGTSFDIEVHIDGVWKGFVTYYKVGPIQKEFITDSNLPLTLTAGSLMTFVAPATTDAGITAFYFSLVGTVA